MFDFEGFDEEYEPAPPGSMMMKAEELTDGEYDFQIASATIKQPKGNTILEMGLTIISGGKHDGMTVQHSLFLNDLDGAKRVGRELLTLGFDSDKWVKAHGRRFSVEFPKALKLLPGVRARGKKTTNPKKDKDGKENGKWHNIYLNSRLLTDGKPERFGPKELDAAAAAPADDDDPFKT